MKVGGLFRTNLFMEDAPVRSLGCFYYILGKAGHSYKGSSLRRFLIKVSQEKTEEKKLPRTVRKPGLQGIGFGRKITRLNHLFGRGK